LPDKNDKDFGDALLMQFKKLFRFWHQRDKIPKDQFDRRITQESRSLMGCLVSGRFWTPAASKVDPPGNSFKTLCPPIISRVLLHRSYHRPERLRNILQQIVPREVSQRFGRLSKLSSSFELLFQLIQR